MVWAKNSRICKSMVSYLQVAAVRLQQVTKRLTHRRRLTLGIVRQRIEGKFIAIVDGLFRSTAPHPQAAWENWYHQPPKPYLSSGGTALRFPIYIPRHVPRYSIPKPLHIASKNLFQICTIHSIYPFARYIFCLLFIIILHPTINSKKSLFLTTSNILPPPASFLLHRIGLSVR